MDWIATVGVLFVIIVTVACAVSVMYVDPFFVEHVSDLPCLKN